MPSTNYVIEAARRILDENKDLFHSTNFKIVRVDPSICKENIFEIFSYKTNIGCFNKTNKKVVLDGRKFSAATTRQQKTIRAELEARGYKITIQQ